MEIELAGAIGWIQGRAGGAGRNGNKRHGRLGPFGKHHRDTIIPADPHGMKRLHDVLYLLVQTPIGKRSAFQGKDRKGVGVS
jgi:hypothetical protein